MASAKDHLPPALSEESIRSLLQAVSLPSPTSIAPLQVAAEFHSIYLLHFAASCADDHAALRPVRTRNADGSATLVLRVSGTHMPARKTLNEVAVMRHLRAHLPSVPVPAVVRFDASPDNDVGAEFTILEKVEGRSVDAMYAELDGARKKWLVEQLTDVLLQMNAHAREHAWTHVGGLSVDAETGEIVPGPVLEDTFWMQPDIERYWGPRESVDTLNPTGPYSSHAEYIAGYLSCLIHGIEVHPSLTWLIDLIPRLRALTSKIPALPSLSETRLLLSHKDMHFANVMALPSGKLTGIIDWEFATVVPALRWDPVRAFLWDAGASGDESAAEKERMRGLFDEELRRRGVERWWESGSETELVWTVIRFVRALVEVCPRGQRKELVDGWKKTAEQALTELGV